MAYGSAHVSPTPATAPPITPSTPSEIGCSAVVGRKGIDLELDLVPGTGDPDEALDALADFAVKLLLQQEGGAAA